MSGSNQRPPEGPFPVRQQQSTAMAEVQQTRAMAEVQSAMIVAKKFPRDGAESYARIMQACQRPSLAEQAMYSYPKGGQMITGPSIRLAEAMAQCWGNVDFGIIELEQNGGESSMLAYCWDLETNTRQTRQFVVRHERHTKQGVQKLTDTRDIYEMTANQGARRLRACIIGVIPGDVTDAAIDACEKTLAKGGGEPLADRVRKMLTAFTAIGVTKKMIEKRLGHKLDATSETEVVTLRKIYSSIKDGMAPASSFFQAETVDVTGSSTKSPNEPAPTAAPTDRRMVNGRNYEATPDGGWLDLESGEVLGVLPEEQYAPTLELS